MTAINRPCSAANLDPANDNIPYDAAFDVRDLVSVEEVMEREELGPNGGVLWAMEELEENFSWLEGSLDECGKYYRCRKRCVNYRADDSRGDDSTRSTRPTRVNDTSYGFAADITATRATRLSCTLRISLGLSKAPLTDCVVDRGHTTARLNCSDSTKSVFKQFIVVLARNVASTLPCRYVYRFVFNCYFSVANLMQSTS